MIEFKGSHFERDVILWAIRWYVAYPISYRQLEEMIEEHGVAVDHATLNRWLLKYVPPLDRVSSVQAPGRSQLANGRDLCAGQGHMEVSCIGPSIRPAPRWSFC
jgi:hypothetical protein